MLSRASDVVNASAKYNEDKFNFESVKRSTLHNWNVWKYSLIQLSARLRELVEIKLCNGILFSLFFWVSYFSTRSDPLIADSGNSTVFKIAYLTLSSEWLRRMSRTNCWKSSSLDDDEQRDPTLRFVMTSRNSSRLNKFCWVWKSTAPTTWMFIIEVNTSDRYYLSTNSWRGVRCRVLNFVLLSVKLSSFKVKYVQPLSMGDTIKYRLNVHSCNNYLPSKSIRINEFSENGFWLHFNPTPRRHEVRKH